MGLFDRWRRPADPGEAAPPERGACGCAEHIEELRELAVPLTLEIREELDEPPMSVAELMDCGALGVNPSSYDDDAPLPLDESLRAQPGVERVLWEDREVIHVGAPRLCHDGILAAAARALIDPRVRLAEG